MAQAKNGQLIKGSIMSTVESILDGAAQKAFESAITALIPVISETIKKEIKTEKEEINIRLLNQTELMAALGIKSRSGLKTITNQPDFPAPLCFGGADRWREIDIHKWLETQSKIAAKVKSCQ